MGQLSFKSLLYTLILQAFIIHSTIRLTWRIWSFFVSVLTTCNIHVFDCHFNFPWRVNWNIHLKDELIAMQQLPCMCSFLSEISSYYPVCRILTCSKLRLSGFFKPSGRCFQLLLIHDNCTPFLSIHMFLWMRRKTSFGKLHFSISFSL